MSAIPYSPQIYNLFLSKVANSPHAKFAVFVWEAQNRLICSSGELEVFSHNFLRIWNKKAGIR